MSEEYARDISRQAVARACLALGINSASLDLIDCLADVTRNYIQSLAKSATELAESSGRAQVGTQDMLSVISTSKLIESKREDLKEFAAPSSGSKGWEQPFPYPVNNFPEPSRSSIKSNQESMHSSIVRKSYVPRHLPPFPPSHTYKLRSMNKGKRKSDVDMIVSEPKAKRSEISAIIQKSLEKLEDAI